MTPSDGQSVQWECWDIYSRCVEEHPWDFAWKSLWKDDSLKDYVANQGTNKPGMFVQLHNLFSM